MTIKPSAFSLSLALVSSLLVMNGCTYTPARVSVPHNVRQQREIQLRRTWQGKPYRTLLDAYGQPKLVMSVGEQTPRKEAIVVYGVVDTVSNCIDAFLVTVQKNDAELIVTDYFCR